MATTKTNKVPQRSFMLPPIAVIDTEAYLASRTDRQTDRRVGGITALLYAVYRRCPTPAHFYLPVCMMMWSFSREWER